MLPKSKTKFIQQHHKLPTLSKFHKLPTLSKLHHDKKINTSKMLQNQHYNMIYHTIPQIPTRTHNKMTMSHRQIFNEAWNNIFPSKETQRKTHVDVHVRIWSMGLGVLKKPLLIMPIKCWIIFLTMKSKKRGSIGRRRHFDAKKNGFENRFCSFLDPLKHNQINLIN